MSMLFVFLVWVFNFVTTQSTASSDSHTMGTHTSKHLQYLPHYSD